MKRTPHRKYEIEYRSPEDSRLERFLVDMEREATRAAVRPTHAEDEGMPTDFLRWEIGLTLGQMLSSRTRQEELLRDLLLSECAVRTELLQMEDRTPRYATYRFPEREKFQRHLRRIEEERRRLLVSHDDRIRNLQDRLLSLLLKHRAVEGGP